MTNTPSSETLLLARALIQQAGVDFGNRDRNRVVFCLAKAIAAIEVPLQQQIETLRENEGAMLRKLSDALTGGNAATWDEIVHAAGHVHEIANTAQEQIETLEKAHKAALHGQFEAKEALRRAEAERDALREEAVHVSRMAVTYRADLPTTDNKSVATVGSNSAPADLEAALRESRARVEQASRLVAKWRSEGHSHAAANELEAALAAAGEVTDTPETKP